MIQRTFASALIMLSLAAGASSLHAKTYKSKVHTFNVETLTDKLDDPWGFAFLPNGAILITEQDGTLRRFKDGRLSAPLSGVPKVKSSGQGGLLDVALDPDFAQTGQIYLTFSEPGAGGAGTAIARATLSEKALKDVRVIFRQNKKTGNTRHYGSRIAFAPLSTHFNTIEG